MSRRVVNAARVAAIALSAILAGCNGGESSSAAAKREKAKRETAKSGPQMVAAVSSNRAQGVVDLRFALAGRPAVGQPVDIRLAITPTQRLEALFVRFLAAEGLEVAKGGETGHLENPPIGTAIDHTVSVVPKSDGIYYLTAVVVSDSETESLTRSYSIPIIAGAGLPELPPSAAVRP